MENIKSEINSYLHQSIGLGKRMPVPESLNFKTASLYQTQLFNRATEIYGRN